MDLATSCYEHACSKFPNNLELMMGLFNCYVREYSFVKQQQVCNLYCFFAWSSLPFNNIYCYIICGQYNIARTYFLIGRQLSKCTNLLEKKGFCFGQSVASNYRFFSLLYTSIVCLSSFVSFLCIFCHVVCFTTEYGLS